MVQARPEGLVDDRPERSAELSRPRAGLIQDIPVEIQGGSHADIIVFSALSVFSLPAIVLSLSKDEGGWFNWVAGVARLKIG